MHRQPQWQLLHARAHCGCLCIWRAHAAVHVKRPTMDTEKARKIPSIQRPPSPATLGHERRQQRGPRLEWCERKRRNSSSSFAWSLSCRFRPTPARARPQSLEAADSDDFALAFEPLLLDTDPGWTCSSLDRRVLSSEAKTACLLLEPGGRIGLALLWELGEDPSVKPRPGRTKVPRVAYCMKQALQKTRPIKPLQS